MPLRVKVRASVLAAKLGARLAVMGVVEEDLVDDEGGVVVAAKSVEGRGFRGGDVGAGGIIGMDNDDGARRERWRPCRASRSRFASRDRR